MNWKQIIALVASIGTIASPIDLIPDAIPVLGLTDDFAAVLLAGFTLYKAVQTLREKRAAQNGGGGAKGAGQPGTGGPASSTSGPAGPGGPAGKGAKIIDDPGDLPSPGRRRK